MNTKTNTAQQGESDEPPYAFVRFSIDYITENKPALSDDVIKSTIERAWKGYEGIIWRAAISHRAGGGVWVGTISSGDIEGNEIDWDVEFDRKVVDALPQLRVPNQHFGLFMAPLYTSPPAAVQPTGNNPLFDRKLADLVQRGYEVIGRILHKGGEYALFDSSCRWLTQPQYQRLMHEQDGSLFGRVEDSGRDAAMLKDRIRLILKGIDKDSTFDDSGYWETSKGVEYGTARLAEIMGAIDTALAAQPTENTAMQSLTDAKEDVIKRVACAICSACSENPYHQGDARGNEFRWQDYSGAAQAAIAAASAKGGK